MTANWRRWAAASGYVGILIMATLLRGGDPVSLALYRVTLPWSALSFGSTSQTVGWIVLTCGAFLNAVVLFLLGFALDQRAADRDRAA